MKQEFETTLIPQDIIVRQSDGEDTHLEQNAAMWFPLIRINDVVLHRSNISSFSYDVGTSILPTLNITISDYDKSFMEEKFIEVDDIVTVRISNNQDTVHKPIKNDFIVLDVSTSAQANMVSISAIQYVTNLHVYNNVGFSDSLFNITKEIARQSGLGFVSNINDSNDSSTWICPNNYYDFLKYIETRMFIASDDCVKIFIDQYNNLNVISLKTALDDRTIYKLLTNPTSGEEYTPHRELKLSNKQFIEETDVHVQINSWSPQTNYGIEFLRSKNIASYIDKSDFKHLNPQQPTTVGVQNVNALDNTQVNVYSGWVDSQTVFGKILSARKQNERMRSIMYQGTVVSATLDYYSADVTCYIHVNVELWNKIRTTRLHSQDENVDLDELSEQQPTYEPNKPTLNTTFSGSYIVLGCEYIYFSPNPMTQNIKMIKV